MGRRLGILERQTVNELYRNPSCICKDLCSVYGYLYEQNFLILFSLTLHSVTSPIPLAATLKTQIFRFPRISTGLH